MLNADFMIMQGMAAAIASLGLLQDSPAVVIGAMLVAPLMTPIVAMGLGHAQANIRLIQIASRTVLRGFTTAFVIGVLIGWLMCDAPTAEMESRGLPNFRDLIIALASGVAAAYALGRPNLLSALPGVAIAAALVPPIATAGMAAALAEWRLAGGALLLFTTNIIAIVLGTTLTFWAIGLARTRTDGQRAARWPRWLLLALVVATVALTAFLQVPKGP